MKTFGIVSHYFKNFTVVFSIEKLMYKPIYLNELIPIGTKVIVEINPYDDKEISNLIYQGNNICDNSDDDILIKILYDLEETSIKPTSNDPFVREDLSQLFVATIDPKGSRDLDDAISIKDDKLYIHIADVVSYYNENIDDILKRGNTYYLRNCNVPMISRDYAENIISLLPGSKKRAITLEFNIDTLELIRYFPSLIENKIQLTYEDVDNILEGQLNNYNNDVIHLVNNMKKIYDKLSILAKVHINMSSLSHKMIEELMILANNAIAKITPNSIYRFHDKPYINKAGYLQRFIGSQLNQYINIDINNITELTKKVPQQKTIEHLIKHMMSKAVYTEENSSHWALNLDKYTHFTSPIRRAADIIVHMKLLLPGIQLDSSNFLDKINHAEEQQKCIESILEELDIRRKTVVGALYQACVIKVTPKSVDYYIPYFNTTHSFHVSECSDGEFLTYSPEKAGQLISTKFYYCLGKCSILLLSDFNISSGKKVFKILQGEVQPELL